MARRHRTALAVVGLLLALAGCTAVGTPSSVEGSWRLKAFNDRTAVVPAGMRFRGDALRLETGCSKGDGTFAFIDEVFTIADMQMTTPSCDGPIGDQEEAFFNVIGDDPTITITGGELTITGRTGGTLVLERVP